MPPLQCRLETFLDSAEILELDKLLTSPGLWPHEIWGIMRPKMLTPAARRWGVMEVGADWLAKKGHKNLGRKDVLRHWRWHVPQTAASLDELAEIAQAIELRRIGAEDAPDGALGLAAFYNKGIRLGNRALSLVERRINAYLNRNEDPPLELLKYAADLAAKLATSAATLTVRGASPMGRDDDVWSSAREPSSPRMGHSRQRTIEGEARMVRDEGPADREEYARRSREQGLESPF
jgi:hypothetical protein